jgi:hypothetical protein
MDSISKAFALLALGSLAILLILAPAGFAFAQGANDEVVSEQPPTIPNISGCWQGNAFNDSQGNTSILFFFAQKKGSLQKKHSTIDLEGTVSVHGPISGTVKATKFKFKSPVAGTGFNPCTIKGTGFFQMDGSLSGNYSYVGNCFEHQFTGGDFSKVEFLGATCP